jgi:hypothetical protein
LSQKNSITQIVGFTGSHLAIRQGVASDYAAVTTYLAANGGQYLGNREISPKGTVEDSGVANPNEGNNDYRWTRHIYYISQHQNKLEFQNYEWRFRIQSQSSGVFSSDWFPELASLAEINASLAATFGMNVNNQPNMFVYLNNIGTSTIVQDTTAALFLGRSGSMFVEGFGAKNSTEEIALGTHAAFRQAFDPAQNISSLTVHIRTTESSERVYPFGFGVIDMDTSDVIWGRNFTPADRDPQPASADLGNGLTYFRDGRLYTFKPGFNLTEAPEVIS